MDKRLATKIGQKSALVSLQTRYQQDMVIRYSSKQNIFYMLTEHDSSIGYTAGKYIYLYDGAWSKIHALVKSETGFDLLYDTVDDLVIKGRVDNALTTKDEKSLSLAPLDGFIMCRLIGSPYELSLATSDCVQTSTNSNTYAGLHISVIKNWNISAIIIIENFASFMAFDENYLLTIDGSDSFTTTLVIYRGHDKQNIYGVAAELAAASAAKYVFADYDLAGLSLSEVIASRVNASGYILPTQPHKEPLLAELSKKPQYDAQAQTVVHDLTLAPYYKDIKSRFIATTQEAIMAHKIPISIVLRNPSQPKPF